MGFAVMEMKIFKNNNKKTTSVSVIADISGTSTFHENISMDWLLTVHCWATLALCQWSNSIFHQIHNVTCKVHKYF